MPGVDWSADVAQAEWIRPRLGSFDSGEVTSVVPAGFAAYARVLHPAHDSMERPVRWSEVAVRNGLELTPDARFPDIALLPPAGIGTQNLDVTGPDEGTLSAADATALVDIVRRHSSAADCCWFCLWDGYGWDSAASTSMSRLRRDDERPVWAEPSPYLGPDRVDRDTPAPGAPPDPVPRRVRNGPRVELPNRTYFLYRGPVEQALAFVESERQTANLWWPEDRSWCVATEIDLEWTYVGGSQALIDDIVADGRLEARRADPRGSHHVRTPAWLTAAVEGAVTQLLAGHQGRVETSRGTVTAWLRRPGRLRHGDLWTTRIHPDGSADGNSWTSLSEPEDEALREDIRHQLSWAVIDLLR